MISVTKLLKKYFEPFDSVGVATKLVNNNPRYAGKTVEDVLKEWDGRRLYGIMIHESIEAYLHGKCLFMPKQQYISNFLDILLKEYNLVETELKIRHEGYGIVGVIDAIFKHKTTGKLLICDWKTNKSIRTYNEYKDCKGCLDHLTDCNFNEYSLQLGLYKALLQDQMNVEDCKLMIFHIMKTKVKPIEVPDLEQEIGFILYELGVL